jgi:hypothetical protein
MKDYKGGLILFRGQVGVGSCGVMDITPIGACLRTQNLAVMPISFELSFDNFQTVRRCRLIWRDGDFVGVAFEN